MYLRGFMLAGSALVLAACGAATTTTRTPSPTSVAQAAKSVTVRVQDSNGNQVATATLTEVSITPSATVSPSAFATSRSTTTGTPNTATSSGTSTTGVRVQIKVTSLSPGSHGLSFTSVGRCDPPSFLTAGAIFDPDRRLHGYDNPAGPKNGDLPDLAVGSDGTGSMDFVTALVTLESGQPNSLDNPNGTALVINARADDQKSQPDGNAGPRIACGVVYPGSTTTPSGSASATSPATRASATPTPTFSAPSPSTTVTGAAN